MSQEIKFLDEDLEILMKHKSARIAYTAGVMLHQRMLDYQEKIVHKNGGQKNETRN